MDSTHRWAWRTDGTGVENVSVRPTIEAEALGNAARSFRRGEVIVICDHWFGRRLACLEEMAAGITGSEWQAIRCWDIRLALRRKLSRPIVSS